MTYVSNEYALGVLSVRFRIVGSDFEQMVRGIAGTLLQVGEGYPPASRYLEYPNRRSVGPTVPARFG